MIKINLFNLMAKISLDDDNFSKGMDKATDSGEKLSKKSEGLGSKLLSLKGVIVGVATGALAVFTKKCLSAASDVQEMQNKFDTVFKDTGDSMNKWAEDFANEIGRNSFDVKTAIANQSDLMMGMGMTEEVAGELSKKYTELAYDLASFNNVQDTTALEAMTKAMYGETEMAKQLGLNLSATTMENSEYVKSLGKSWSALTQAEKAEAYYQEALKQSPNAFGDAIRSADSYESTMRRASGKVTELYQTIGGYLIPVATKVVDAFGDMVQGSINFIRGIEETFQVFKAKVEEGQTPLEAFSSVLSEKFGIELPNTFSFLVTSVQNFFTSLWEILVDIWETVGKPIFDAIVEIWNNTKADADLIFNAISNLFDIMTSVIKTIYETIFKPIFETLMELLDITREWFEEKFGSMGEAFNEFVLDIKDFWDEHLKPCFEAIGNFLKTVLLPAFEWVFKNAILPLIEGVFKTIDNLWNNSLKPVFTGIIDFITGVFTGDWSLAWQGVVNALGGVWEGIKEVIKAPLNGAIWLVNKAIGFFNSLSVKIPDWVPEEWGGGQSFGLNIPSISYLENGGILTEPTFLNANVMAGEKNKGRSSQAEAVVPLDDLKQWITELASRPVKVAIDGHEFINATIENFSDELAFKMERELVFR